MRKIYLVLSMTISTFFASAQQFTPDNLVVVVAGDGSADNNTVTNPLFLKEYTTAGTLVGTPLAMPTAVVGENLRLVAPKDRNAIPFGLITLSQDGTTLALTGYDMNAGENISPGAATKRVIGLIDASKTVSTKNYVLGSNGLTPTSTDFGTPRNAIYHNGYAYYNLSAGGLAAVKVDDNSFTVITTRNSRAVGIFNNQLYGSSNGIANQMVYTIGDGVPTSGLATPAGLFSSVTTDSPYQFVFMDTDGNLAPDLLYVATADGLRKYWYNGTAWVAKGTFAITGLCANTLVGLTGRYTTTNGAVLYGTTNSCLLKLKDTAVPSADIAITQDDLLTAEANTVFKGVAFTPGTNVLPVKLTSFTGQTQNNTVELSWTTASEKGNSHFDVLRSANGTTFTKLGDLQGSGTSNTANNYSYTDRFPYKGDNYYKLKQVDFNGNIEESHVIAVKALANTPEIKVYQQGEAIAVEVYSVTAGPGTLTVTDISGKVISSRKVDLTAGNNQFSANLGTAPKGVYLVKVVSEGKTVSTKILK